MGQPKSGRYKRLSPGLQVGKLTFIEELPEKDKYGRYFVRCKCVCGSTPIIRKNAFLCGKTASCGCLQRAAVVKTNLAKRAAPGWSNFGDIYAAYRRGAVRRGLSFELTKDEFYHKTQQPCYYCGSRPETIRAQPQHYGAYVYNGVDRVDNHLGYSSENSVPCCKLCNRAKGTLTKLEFLNWVARVCAHQAGRI